MGITRCNRGSVLDEAKKVINGERQDTYGNPEDSFQLIGELWTAYIKAKFKAPGVKLTRKDATLMMTLFKIAREANQGKRDNLVDAAGYIGIAGDMTDASKFVDDSAGKISQNEFEEPVDKYRRPYERLKKLLDAQCKDRIDSWDCTDTL